MAAAQSKSERHGKLARLWRNEDFRTFAVAFIWLIVISSLHYWRNVEHSDANVIKMGYMPVITNLACPLLAEASKDGEVRFAALKYASFAEMAESFRNDSIQVAFIIAPLPFVLRSQGTPAKIVYIGNRHESTLVARKDLAIPRRQFPALAGKTIAVPMRYSGHNLAVKMLLDRYGMGQDGVHIVEMQPPDMASAMESGNLDAYFVGEPFAAQTLMSGSASLVFYVEEVWEGFICNLVIVSDEMIRKHPDQVQLLVSAAARSGRWARQYPDAAAAVASRYWGQDEALVRYALNTPPDRIQYNSYTPKREELKEIFDYMVKYGLMDGAKAWVLDEVFDDTFAKKVSFEGIGESIKTIIPR